MQIELAAEKVFELFHFPITNTLLMAWIVILLLSGIALFVYRKIAVIPSAVQNMLEIMVEKFLGIMEGLFDSRKTAEKYFPIVATIFLFLLISNWLGIMPGVGTVGFFEIKDGKEFFIPLFRSSASDLNFTLALAISAVFSINFFGIIALGFWKHAAKFFTIRGPIEFFVGILEFISEIAKMISFAFRLFGNVFAGEVLLVITAFLVPYLIPVPFLLLEIFVGFVQALVFAMLTMVFISIAVAHNH